MKTKFSCFSHWAPRKWSLGNRREVTRSSDWVLRIFDRPRIVHLIYPAEVSKQKAAIQHHMLRCRHTRGFRRGRRKWQDMTASCGGDCGWGAGDTTKLCGNKAPLICLLPSLRKSRFRGITQFRDRSKSVGTHTHYPSSLCFALFAHQICPPAKMLHMPVILNWLSRKKTTPTVSSGFSLPSPEHLTQDTLRSNE